MFKEKKPVIAIQWVFNEHERESVYILEMWMIARAAISKIMDFKKEFDEEEKKQKQIVFISN